MLCNKLSPPLAHSINILCLHFLSSSDCKPIFFLTSSSQWGPRPVIIQVTFQFTSIPGVLHRIQDNASGWNLTRNLYNTIMFFWFPRHSALDWSLGSICFLQIPVLFFPGSENSDWGLFQNRISTQKTLSCWQTQHRSFFSFLQEEYAQENILRKWCQWFLFLFWLKLANDILVPKTSVPRK